MSPSVRSALVGCALVSALASPPGEHAAGLRTAGHPGDARVEHGREAMPCAHDSHRGARLALAECPWCGRLLPAHRVAADRIAAARPEGPRPRAGLPHGHRRHLPRPRVPGRALAAGERADASHPGVRDRRRRGARGRRRSHVARDEDGPARHHRAERERGRFPVERRGRSLLRRTAARQGEQRAEVPSAVLEVEGAIAHRVHGLAVLRGPDLVFELANAAFGAVAPTRELVGQTLGAAWPELKASLLPGILRAAERGEPVDCRVLLCVRGPGRAARMLDVSCTSLPGAPGRAPSLVLCAVEAPAPPLPAGLGSDEAACAQELPATLLAHELRSPISAIGMTSTALLARGGLSEREADAVERIASVARRMQDLVADMLDAARVQQCGGFVLECAPARIETICARAIRQQLEAHPGGRVELALSGPGDGVWDPGRLEQVISNLVENGLERAPVGATVQVRAAGTADALVLTVRNEGPPIPRELLPVLFEPFRRGDRKGSLGLGLFIVKGIVEAHGGEVSAASSAGEGTLFLVRIPRHPAAARPA